jgi:lysophospholipase L1-like esterase
VPTFRLAVLGDQMSCATDDLPEEALWWSLFREALSPNVLSLAVSASPGTAFSLGDRAEDVPWLEERLTDLASQGEPDLILVLIGSRDAAYGNAGQVVPGAEPSAIAAQAASSARGAQLTLLKLRELYPNARVAVLIPPEVLADEQMDGLTLQRYNWACNSIADAARSLGLTIVDLRDSGIDPDHPGLYTADGLSLNAEGMIVLAKWLVLNFPRIHP